MPATRDFINWQDEVFGRDAFQQTHNVSVSGGAKGTTYSLSLTRNVENGIQLGSGFDRNLVNFRFDTQGQRQVPPGLHRPLHRPGDQRRRNHDSTTGSTTSTRLRNALVYLPMLTPQQANAGVAIDDYPDDEFFSALQLLTNPILTINNEYRRKNRAACST